MLCHRMREYSLITPHFVAHNKATLFLWNSFCQSFCHFPTKTGCAADEQFSSSGSNSQKFQATVVTAAGEWVKARRRGVSPLFPIVEEQAVLGALEPRTPHHGGVEEEMTT